MADSSGVGTPGRHESRTVKNALRRGRVARPLAIGALTEALVATLWVTLGVGRVPLTAIFVASMLLVAVWNQLRLDGIARLIWAATGSFWAGLAFWFASVPMTLQSRVAKRVLVFPLLVQPQDFDAAFNLLPIVGTALSIGLLVGAFGWAVTSTTTARTNEAEIFGLGDSADPAVPTPADPAPAAVNATSSPISSQTPDAVARPGDGDGDGADLANIWGPPRT